jgi:hypothetical protein
MKTGRLGNPSHTRIHVSGLLQPGDVLWIGDLNTRSVVARGPDVDATTLAVWGNQSSHESPIP